MPPIGTPSYSIVPEVGTTSPDTKLDIQSNDRLTLNKTITIGAQESLFLELDFVEHNMTTPVFRGAEITYTE